MAILACLAIYIYSISGVPPAEAIGARRRRLLLLVLLANPGRAWSARNTFHLYPRPIHVLPCIRPVPLRHLSLFYTLFQTPAELLKAMPTITRAVQGERTVTRRSLQRPPPAGSPTGTRESPSRVGPGKFSVARLPITGSEIFGRDKDGAFLETGWANHQIKHRDHRCLGTELGSRRLSTIA